MAKLVADNKDGTLSADQIVSPTKEAKLKWLTGLLGAGMHYGGQGRRHSLHPPPCLCTSYLLFAYIVYPCTCTHSPHPPPWPGHSFPFSAATMSEQSG